MKFINESMYCHGTGRISNCLNRLLQEVLGLCNSHNSDGFLLQNENLPTVGRITPQYSTLYNRMKVCTVILIIKANKIQYFSNLFDIVLYMFQAGPLSIIRSISTSYTCSIQCSDTCLKHVVLYQINLRNCASHWLLL